MPAPPLRILAALLVSGIAAAAQAESELRFALPEGFGSIPAATYDDQGRRIGGAFVSIQRADGGLVRLLSESGFEGGARTLAVADLAPVNDGNALQLVRQESRSITPEGEPIGVLTIDHAAATASCARSEGDQTVVQEVALPALDRVANIPMNLLFLPLLRGEKKELSFQLFLCREGPRFLDFAASVAQRSNGHDGVGEIVEVRYAPDLGPFVSMLAQNFVPRLSFWFEGNSPYRWIAHRLPLYAKGPEVLVIRDGVPASWLADSH
jgi:hypothetical protein